MEKDPENKLLWKFSRRRLEAEEIRDAMLAVSGTLNPRQGGPSVMVPVDQELVNPLYKPSQWAVTPRSRRAQPPQHLPDRQAQSAAAVHGSLRCAGSAGELRAPRIEHARAAGAGTAERRLRQPAGRGVSPSGSEAEAGPSRRKQIDLAYRLVAGTPARRQGNASWRWLS